jgi:hypothetical protein
MLYTLDNIQVKKAPRPFHLAKYKTAAKLKTQEPNKKVILRAEDVRFNSAASDCATFSDLYPLGIKTSIMRERKRKHPI